MTRTRFVKVNLVLPTHRGLLCHSYTALLRSHHDFFPSKLREKKKKKKKTGGRNWLFSIQSDKLRQLKAEDENKVPDISRTKLVLVFVYVLESKAL